MAVTLGILTETAPHEARVAATPDTVKKYVASGARVLVQSGAGANAFYGDAAYAAAGAEIISDDVSVARASGVLLCVGAPSVPVLDALPKGAVLVGLVNPHQSPDLIRACAERGITLVSMEMIPRISRAQSMDVLSSQAGLAGYRAVLDAVAFYPRALPMMMTAAGTVPPARVFVMGAGVAGLQAIATARRLGAIVSATDVRMAAKEQVASLGAAFVMVDDNEMASAESTGGYAREMSDAFKQKQAALIAQTISKQDIVITTALIPGKPAPRLVNADMVASMRPGSVIVDMAAGQGGNVEGTVPGSVIVKNGVTLIGYTNIPSRIASDSSALYARNMHAFYNLIVPNGTDTPVFNFDDDIIKASVITHQGQIVHPNFQG